MNGYNGCIRSIYDLSPSQPYTPCAAAGNRLVMGHQNQCGTALAVQLKHEFYDLRACGGIQIPGRLVGQKQLRLGHECSRDGDTLLLAAGKLPGIMLQAHSEPDPFKQLQCRGLNVIGTGEFQWQHHILDRGQCGQQLKRLKHETQYATTHRRPRIFIQ